MNALPLRLSRRRCLLAAGTLLASGCGFRLRESAELPFRTLHARITPGSSLAIEFARQARQGTRLVDDEKQAEAVLELLVERRDKEVVSFSRSGRPREYELRYRVGFRLLTRDAEVLLPETEITLRRYITTTDLEQLSEELEEAFLYDKMESDMVQQMLRRLAVVKPAG